MRLNKAIEKKKAKRDILPFFIPMEGCPFQCIYCDQRTITGQEKSLSAGQIKEELANYRGNAPFTVAYYGGTFSALPFSRQKAYLEILEPYIEAGEIVSVRISTRPDCIDEEILHFLASLHVDTIELGVQSFFDDVLKASGRHYPAATAERSCRMIKEAGFKLGVQLMTGLPEDHDGKSLLSLKRALDLQCDMLRIYPTLVMRDTPLAKLYQKGSYRPQELEEAVDLCRDMLALAERAGVPVIRMGLNPSPGIEKSLIAGPYHPAFGHLVFTALKRRQLELLLDGENNREIVVFLPQRDLSQGIGQGKSNLIWFRENNDLELVFQVDKGLPSGTLAYDKKDQDRKILLYDEFIDKYCMSLDSQISNIYGYTEENT